MHVYSAVVLVLIVIGLLFKGFKNGQKYFCFAATVILVILLGCRDTSVGVDLIRYARHYDNIEKLSFWNAVTYTDDSWLYYSLNWLCAKINLSFQAFLFVLAMFEVCVISKFIYRFSQHKLFSYIVILGMGCFTFLFSGLRQGVAMAISILCFEAILDKKYAKAFIGVIVAIGFHPTAIILLPFFLISRLKFRKQLVYIYFIVFVFCMIFRVQLAHFITLLYQDEYIGRYISKQSIGGTSIFSMIITCLYFMVRWNYITKEDTIDFYLAHGLILLNIIQLFSSYAYIFTRLNLYYMLMIVPLVLPVIGRKECFDKFSKNLSVIISTMFVIVCIGIMLVQFQVHISGELLLDYMFFWEG